MGRLLILSAIFNVALSGALIFYPRPETTAVPGSAAPLITWAPKTAPAQTPQRQNHPSAGDFHWYQLESEDFFTYLANLRRIGCPEPIIREIILAEIDEIADQRLQALHRQGLGSFWQTGEQLEAAQRTRKNQEIELGKEKLGWVRALLRFEFNREALENWRQQDFLAYFLGYLPEAKAEQVISLFSNYEELSDGLFDNQIRTPEDAQEKQKGFQRFLLDLGQILSPDEQQEAQLRLLFGAEYLFFDEQQLRALKLAGSELREIMRLKWIYANPITAEWEWPDETTDARRRQSQKELETRILVLLGEDRFYDYQRVHNAQFKILAELVEKHHLPRPHAFQLHEITQTAEEEVQRLSSQASLSWSKRREALLSVQQTTLEALAKLLGDPALADYLQQQGNWLQQLAKK